ncbi:MAG: dihydrolipoyl dehydrogenase [Acidobacteria bacterium]|nr:dihydrolipoyl dehydrogenase [Acidobacteriota bacterium]
MTDFDLIVIGAGTGGYVAAIHAAQAGLRTALIEKNENLGGDAILHGLVPRRSWQQSAAVFEQTQSAAEFGVLASNVALDFEAVQRYKNKTVLKSVKALDYLMNKNKVKVLKGQGKLEDPTTVVVTTPTGEQRITTGKIILATGSTSRTLPELPIDGQFILNSAQLVEIGSLPKSLAIVGAGSTGVELASALARFGVAVTLIEQQNRVLPHEDEAISLEFERSLRGLGIKIKNHTYCEHAEVTGTGVELTLRNQVGERLSLSVDKVCVTVGRVPQSAGLGLEWTQAAIKKGYVQVNKMLQTAEPTIYAVGDVADTVWLPHVAASEGLLAVGHILERDEVDPINYAHVPSCTYSDPEVASVGLTEAAAKARGHKVRTGSFPFVANTQARVLNQTEGMVKLVSDAQYDELLGVHIVGARATELIAEACIALRGEMTIDELIRTLHAHPTLSEALWEAALTIHSRPIRF